MPAKILYLTLKKKWFDLIADGEKTEEYREIKPYWINRFVDTWEHVGPKKGLLPNAGNQYSYNTPKMFAKYDAIVFRNGYGKNAPECIVECLGLGIAEGRHEWGADPDTKYFVLKLGKVITTIR